MACDCTVNCHSECSVGLSAFLGVGTFVQLKEAGGRSITKVLIT